MAQKPSIPKGTRDFSPAEVAKRNYVINTIRSQFQRFGFQPIETPSFENSDTLMGKYGEEGDRLIFKILDSGEFYENQEETIKLKHYVDTFLNKEFYLSLYEEIKNDVSFQKMKDLHFEFPQKDKETFHHYLITSLNVKAKPVIESITSFNKSLGDSLHRVLFLQMDMIESYSETILKKIHFNPNSPIIINSDINRMILKLIGERENPSLSQFLGNKISGKALRYDLTVPFARYVVQHQSEIEFPFKRYQIQPVWRADRPQKGRFREFFQCDADVVGSDSLWQEVEFVQLYDAVFSELGLNGVTIKINNRKILSGFAEVIGEQEKLIDFTVALDKLDKIGEEGVKKEMLEKGISEKALESIQPIFSLKGSFEHKIEVLNEILESSEIGQKGIEELKFVNSAISKMPLKTAKLDLDVTLARGLNYYTGAIFEVSAPQEVQMGSIGGGGRYDDLTGIFGLKNMSGVGISFGLDRIYLVLEELDLFPKAVTANTKVMFINFGVKEALYGLQAVQKLRDAGISAEIYPDDAKMKKQMNYANKRDIPFVILAGAEEIEMKKYGFKNMKTGDQEKVSLEKLIDLLK